MELETGGLREDFWSSPWVMTRLELVFGRWFDNTRPNMDFLSPSRHVPGQMTDKKDSRSEIVVAISLLNWTHRLGQKLIQNNALSTTLR